MAIDIDHAMRVLRNAGAQIVMLGTSHDPSIEVTRIIADIGPVRFRIMSDRALCNCTDASLWLSADTARDLSIALEQAARVLRLIESQDP